MLKHFRYLFIAAGIALLFAGCGSEVNEDFSGFGNGGDYHPFTSDSEHGAYLAQNGYDFSECAVCHGDNLDGGGNPEMSCSGSGCHNAAFGGPWACNTCHGSFSANPALPASWAPPASSTDPHQSHINQSASFAAIECLSCHIVPQNYAQAGHIYNDSTPGDVEIVFGGIALTGGLTPVWDEDAGTCASAYCHGAATPVWQQVNGTWSACGTCHSIPPSDPIHDFWSTSPCSNCHRTVVDEDTSFIAPELHVNGTVNF